MKRYIKANIKSDILDFVKNQTGVDIDKFRSSASMRFEGKNDVVIDLTEVPAVDLNRLYDLSRASYSRNIQIQPLGTCMLAISWKAAE